MVILVKIEIRVRVFEKSKKIKLRFLSALLIYFSKLNYFLGFLIAACAAASLAIGTLNGEQET